MILDQSEKLHLILVSEGQQLIEQLIGRRRPNETMNVNIHKRGHYDLTVKSIHEAAMSGNSIAKVFYLKRALKSAGKEASEGPNRRRKYRQGQRMLLERMQVDLEVGQHIIGGHLEHAQRLTILSSHALTRVVILERTHKLLVIAEQRGHGEAEQDCGERAAYIALPGFLGRQFDEPCLTEEEAKHVRHYIVANDQ